MPRRIGSLLVVPMCAPAFAQVTQRVNVNSQGVPANSVSIHASISANGRYIAFGSFASNLVPGDTNQELDVFVRDRRNGTTTRVSLDSNGSQVSGQCAEPAISANGRFVAFWSSVAMVPSDTSFYGDIFVRDLLTGTIEHVSIGANGQSNDGDSELPSISDDGRFVLFASRASNLVPGDTNNIQDVFVRDRLTQTTECVTAPSGPQPSQGSFLTSGKISGSGRYAVFQTPSNLIIPGLPIQQLNVFVRDRLTGSVELINVDPSGAQAQGFSWESSISAEGRFVAFASDSTSIVAGDTNAARDIFVRDRMMGTTERVSVSSTGQQADDHSNLTAISADGRYVAFTSDAANLVVGDTNNYADTFLRDRLHGTTELLSIAFDGTSADVGASGLVGLSPEGRFAVFTSGSNNLLPGHSGGGIYVRDHLGGTLFASHCDPGTGGVPSCPCSNPEIGPGRGCDNSAGTGGATLEASGGAFLSSDSLVFATSGQVPGELSIVTQWSGASAAGTTYGMGVRCTSGSPKRLYTKAAVGGGVTAPDFGAGELQVSRRSAALGDAIVLGQSRWYLVYYRDPIVLGGCPAGSTFNATQTGQVVWSP